MQRRVKVSILASMLTILCCSTAFAQQLRDTPSHRFIPAGQAPKRSAFETSDYLKALEAYKELRGTNRAPRRNADSAPTMPHFDPSMIEDLSPDTKELLRSWSKDSMREIAGQIGKEISSFNEQMRQNAGQPNPDGSTQQVPFDFSRDVLERYKNVRNTYNDERKAVAAEFRKALQEYKEKWPMERIPPEQWLDKVQPFINSEVLEQLKHARDLKDGKISKTPKPDQPDTMPLKGLSARLIDSVVKSLDYQGNEFIKSAKQRDKPKKNSPWWKRFKASADAQIKSINESITNRTEQYAATAAASEATRSPTAASQSGTAFNSQTAGAIAAAAIALALGLFLLIRWQTQRTAARDHDFTETMDPTMIRDRESLLRAIHGVATKRLGRGSRYWHHRELFEQFREASLSDPAVAKLYERARYAPDGHNLSGGDLDSARRWYETVQNTDVVQP